MDASDIPGSLLQISDPHFGTEQPDRVEALVEWVARHHPVLAVMSGDLTQRATADQFAAVRRFIDRLAPVPVLAIPGNHDIPLFALHERLLTPYRRWRAALGAHGDRVWGDAHWQVVALDTTRRLRHTRGSVSPRQVRDSVLALRRAAPGAVRVVVTHQPVAVWLAEDRGNRLRRAEAALTAWRGAGADLILGGHIHLPHAMHLLHPQRSLWAVQAGTAVSHRVRGGAPNGFHELRPAPPAAPRGCTLREWRWTGHRFEALDDRWLALDPTDPPPQERRSP